jgi:GNAT superfamily N-acetyltransferase
MGMTVIPYRGNVEPLRPLVNEWVEMAKRHCLGMDITAECVMSDLSRQDWMQLFLLCEDYDVRGFLAVEICPNPIGSDIVANERYWYVSPKARGIGSLKLFRAAKNWAKTCGASVFLSTASNLGSDMHDRLCELYEKLGMEKHQTIYSVRL